MKVIRAVFAILALNMLVGQAQAQTVVKGIKCADALGAIPGPGTMVHEYRGTGSALITTQVVRDGCRPKGIGEFRLATFNQSDFNVFLDQMFRVNRFSTSASRAGTFDFSWVVRFNVPIDTTVRGTFDYTYTITPEP